MLLIFFIPSKNIRKLEIFCCQENRKRPVIWNDLRGVHNIFKALQRNVKRVFWFNSFHGNVFFLYPLKTSETRRRILLWNWLIFFIPSKVFINFYPFVPIAPFLNPLKTSENLRVEKGFIGNNWGKFIFGFRGK